MSELINKLKNKTIAVQIIELLATNEGLRFGQIKEKLKKHDQIINRELKRLMSLEPPLILKSDDKTYSINRKYPELDKILLTLKVIPLNKAIYPVLSITDPDNGHSIGVSVTTTPLKGLDAFFCTYAARDEVSEHIAELYNDFLISKLIVTLKAKILEGELEIQNVLTDDNKVNMESENVKNTMKEVLADGIELHIFTDVTGEWKKASNRPYTKKQKEIMEEINGVIDNI
ncbi:MAG: hypothetical protein PWP14_1588 [Methanolobus sp.]|nr:hypothetical protein [Methanolobus sp.]